MGPMCLQQDRCSTNQHCVDQCDRTATCKPRSGKEFVIGRTPSPLAHLRQYKK